MLKAAEPDEHQKKLIEKKRAELENTQQEEDAQNQPSSEFPKTAELCKKCNHKAVIMMDGCMTCLNCGDSKCG